VGLLREFLGGFSRSLTRWPSHVRDRHTGPSLRLPTYTTRGDSLTLGAEFAYARPWTSETQRTDYLQRWLIHYNYHRAHTAIGNQPPATLTPTTVTNVMMQNS